MTPLQDLLARALRESILGCRERHGIIDRDHAVVSELTACGQFECSWNIPLEHRATVAAPDPTALLCAPLATEAGAEPVSDEIRERPS